MQNLSGPSADVMPLLPEYYRDDNFTKALAVVNDAMVESGSSAKVRLRYVNQAKHGTVRLRSGPCC